MLVEGGPLRERLAACLADEGLLPRMRGHVILEVAGCRVRRAANQADMRPHPLVNPQVPNQGALT
jgi:hypothetical protein